MRTNRNHREEKTSMSRRLPILIVALLAVVAAVFLTGSSSASFVSRTTSASAVTAAADWTPPTVAVTAPAAGTTLKGTAAITATATDTSGIASVTIQRAPAGSSSWTTICSDTAAPFSCSWITTAVADGSYDLRAIAADTADNSATSASIRVKVANAAATPTVTLTLPSSDLRGTVTATTTITNASSSDIQGVRVDYSTDNATWNPICWIATAPFDCTADTTYAANGTYYLRSVATIGNKTYTSAAVGNVIIDNLAPTVTMTDPGTRLSGTKTFRASASDEHSGLDTVVIQAKRGTGAWATLCAVSAPSFSCSYNTSKLANGTYSFRAVATDNAGNVTTSAEVVNRSVSNTAAATTLSAPDAAAKTSVAAPDTTPGAGVDIQTINGGTAGIIDRGDMIVYTFSEKMDLGSIHSGWDGTATTGGATVLTAEQGGRDLALSRPSGADLGSVALNAGFGSVRLDATITMSASTVTANGVERTVVTLRIDSVPAANPVTDAASLVWTPSSAIRDLAGNPISTVDVIESGPKDVDF